ncbi:cytochrome c oxidase assembly factor CtaG [Alkalicoccus urumqiensis]|uniref:Cytochrome c oxidase assembly factor CtaG n=1 Tax=Alkalicoccus urumqiensis TaxID=1548213 RepID=A0A2P6MD78_ALKUR|nr:cytochrome c oxidase assembly factor CtaG [Alkalicoccus urumqiensis]PRO64222.1 cytochrome c oxidase assembly factor CtaG [Alkalicoccus urumqiensis]
MEQFFSTFSARAIWTPELILILALISAVYFLMITKWRHRLPDAEPVPVKRRVYFHLGLLGVYIGFGGPLYVLGHMMLSMHMTAMAVVYLIAPPLLILGMPSWFFEGLRPFKLLRGMFVAVGFPLIGLLSFNAAFSVYHLPGVFDYLLTNEGLHNVYQLGMFALALLMWWHIIPRVKTRFHLSELKQIGYMVASGVLFTPACALIIFAGEPLYATYTDPAVWSQAIAYCLPPGADIPYSLLSGSQSLTFLSPTNDQQFGGALMKIVQELVYGIAIGVSFRAWMKRDREETPKVVHQEYEMYEPNAQ